MARGTVRASVRTYAVKTPEATETDATVLAEYAAEAGPVT
jgi:hypothetical protein